VNESRPWFGSVRSHPTSGGLPRIDFADSTTRRWPNYSIPWSPSLVFCALAKKMSRRVLIAVVHTAMIESLRGED
jgi:hypothetical protein